MCDSQSGLVALQAGQIGPSGHAPGRWARDRDPVIQFLPEPDDTGNRLGPRLKLSDPAPEFGGAAFERHGLNFDALRLAPARSAIDLGRYRGNLECARPAGHHAKTAQEQVPLRDDGADAAGCDRFEFGANQPGPRAGDPRQLRPWAARRPRPRPPPALILARRNGDRAAPTCTRSDSELWPSCAKVPGWTGSQIRPKSAERTRKLGDQGTTRRITDARSKQ